MVWPLVALWVGTLVLSYALRPKPKIQKRPDAVPLTFDDFQAPTAEDGREIPVLFGTREVTGPNVVWYGDLAAEDIEDTQRIRVPRGGVRGFFGSTRKKTITTTVGFKYYMGMHMGMVHGPVDSLNRIRAADDVVWLGPQIGSGSFEIDQPEVFGGEDGEGGIQGTFTFADGDAIQLPDGYLTSQLGTPIPAFRGVACGILEQMYVTANNPYLKPWAFYLTRTDVTTRGEAQWYVEKARIGGSL